MADNVNQGIVFSWDHVNIPEDDHRLELSGETGLQAINEGQLQTQAQTKRRLTNAWLNIEAMEPLYNIINYEIVKE